MTRESMQIKKPVSASGEVIPTLEHGSRVSGGHEKIHLATPAPPRPRRGWLNLLLVVVGILASGYGVHRFTKAKAEVAVPANASPAPVVTVDTRPSALQTIPQSLVVTGTITAWDQLTVGAEVNGLRIDSVPVDEGHHVTRGQVLAVLDASVLRAQLKQYQARLASSRAAARKAVQPNRPQDIAGLRSAVHQAEANLSQERANLLTARANLTNAEINERRYQSLVGQGYATQQEVENRKAEYDRCRAAMDAARQRIQAARFGLDQARQRLSLAEAGGRAEDVEMAVASASEIEAYIQQVEAQLAQTVIRAPDDGLIVKRDAHIGDITSAGKSLFTMVRQGRLELKAQVPQTDLHRVRLGSRVELTSGTQKVVGRVREITPLLDAQSRLATVRIDVPTSGLMPGMFVRGVLEAGSRQALVVPSTAVQGQSEAYFVYLLEQGRARKQSVTVNERVGDMVEIASGLKAGQPVIVSGCAFLTDGDTVMLKEEASQGKQ